jgi:hypothetical protein
MTKRNILIWIIVWGLMLLWFNGAFAQVPIPNITIPKAPEDSANWGIGAIAMGALWVVKEIIEKLFDFLKRKNGNGTVQESQAYVKSKCPFHDDFVGEYRKGFEELKHGQEQAFSKLDDIKQCVDTKLSDLFDRTSLNKEDIIRLQEQAKRDKSEIKR